MSFKNRASRIPTNDSFPRQGYRGYIVNLSETTLKTLGELLSLNQRVLGSSPSASTIHNVGNAGFFSRWTDVPPTCSDKPFRQTGHHIAIPCA